MTLWHLFKVLRVRWLLIGAATLVGLIGGIAYAWLTPPTYNAAASLIAIVRASDAIGPQSLDEQLSPDYLLTQEDVLKSERVAQQVVADTGIARSKDAVQRFGWEPADGPLADFIARQLRAGLTVGSSATNSRVMEVGYLSRDPVSSARMANAFASAFIDVNLQLQADPARESIRSYTRQLEVLGERMRASQAVLAAKERALGIVASKGEKDPDSSKLDALSAGFASAQANTASVSSRTLASSLPDALSSPVVQGLQGEIARLEAQRRQLATVAGPNHPDYIQLGSQIAELRQQLGRQQALIRQSASVAAAQARSAERQMSQAVAAQRGQVIDSRAAQSEVAVLEQDLANLRASYDQIGQRRAQLQVLDNIAQTNIAILSRAVPNGKPVAPRPAFNILVGLFSGLVAGIAIAVVLELLDRRIRSSRELEAWLGIADLGSIRVVGGERATSPHFISGLLPPAVP